MYFHGRLNGEIFCTKKPLLTKGGVHWDNSPGNALAVINCSDLETTKECLEEFKQLLSSQAISENLHEI